MDLITCADETDATASAAARVIQDAALLAMVADLRRMIDREFQPALPVAMNDNVLRPHDIAPLSSRR
ncbi:hypothetical protein [Phenylobacterium zucineum]|uniref:hypothetical protein n=1 Tax=Phenylobacterium zucineum TaxID=284016 RepID=UPI00059E2A71|nr:hypothetical protein [Phenylobacterium zucineum]